MFLEQFSLPIGLRGFMPANAHSELSILESLARKKDISDLPVDYRGIFTANNKQI